MVVADIMKADSYGNPVNNQNLHSRISLQQVGSTLNATMELNQYSANQEYYIRFQFKKPGDANFGHTLWATYDRVNNVITSIPLNQTDYPTGTEVKAVFEAKYCSFTAGGNGNFCGGVTDTNSNQFINEPPYVITLTY